MAKYRGGRPAPAPIDTESLPLRLFSEPATAKMLDVSVRTLARLVESGQLVCRKVGGQRRYLLHDIESYLDEVKMIGGAA